MKSSSFCLGRMKKPFKQEAEICQRLPNMYIWTVTGLVSTLCKVSQDNPEETKKLTAKVFGGCEKCHSLINSYQKET